MNLKVFIGIFIIIVFMIFGALSFRKNLTPYVSFEQAKKSEGVIQIIGKLVLDETEYDLKKNLLHFTLKNQKEERLSVVYDGIKPANFEQATDIVVIGKYEFDKFVAEQVLVKCPSKYQGNER